MSYMPGFYQNGSNFTFRGNMQNMPAQFPLPPPPPPPVTPFMFTPELSDQEYVRKFEIRIPKDESKSKVSLVNVSVSELHGNLCSLVLSLCHIKNQERKLAANLNSMSDNEWKSSLACIQVTKNNIEEVISKLSGSYLDMSRKLVGKRAAKRLRLKKLKEERKRVKQERLKQLKERSRKIDENLQKIKDDIQRAKQVEETKVQADMILKEVLRKKHDAKKCIAKLEALLKLRRARLNSAKGRGQTVSDTEANTFQNNIERIKKLWECKLTNYEKEECDSRELLAKSERRGNTGMESERKVEEGLVKWRKVMFGCDGYPQADFEGDVTRFIAIRSQWDQYVAAGPESTPLAAGWVVPVTSSVR